MMILNKEVLCESCFLRGDHKMKKNQSSKIGFSPPPSFIFPKREGTKPQLLCAAFSAGAAAFLTEVQTRKNIFLFN